MRNRIATILVLLAMLPQLVLGMGSGRVLEICLCGLLGSHAESSAVHCHDHADAHGHVHHHHPHTPSAYDRSHAEDRQSHVCGDRECGEEPTPGCHSCDHLVVTGQFGRFEPAQSWNEFAILNALACVCVEAVVIDERPIRRIRPDDSKPPGDTLFATRTTSLQI